MTITQLSAMVLRVPLKRSFAHASATRHDSENVLVRCQLADGTTGWGEGVPRPYVTGETPASCLQQFAATPWPELLARDCQAWPDVVAMLLAVSLTPQGDNPRDCVGNALRCAVELAVLDAYGRRFGESVSRACDFVPLAAKLRTALPRVRYSTTIDAQSPQRLWRSALQMRLFGFRQCKLKVGFDDDPARLLMVRRWLGRHVDLRVDANEAWHADELPLRMAPLRHAGVTCLEQPVPHAELATLRELPQPLGVPVMLDESLTSRVDAEAALRLGVGELWNLRLSKCGGLLACIELAELAERSGVGFQLGCHPGETGLLSAAGRHFATRIAGARYLEGSYDRFVLRELPTRENITFGYGGLAPALTRPGLGVTLDEARIAPLLGPRQVAQW